MLKLLFMLIIMFIISITIINLFIIMIPSNYNFIHPIIMSIILLFMMIFSSLNLSIFNNTHWFSYIMFLMIVGGLMILFLYFTSFMNNLMMSMKLIFYQMLPFKFLLMIIFLFIMLINNKFNLIWYQNFNEIMNLNLLMKYNLLNNNLQIKYMYMYNKNFMVLICMIYLFFCMTLIIKICIFKKLTLRKIN